VIASERGSAASPFPDVTPLGLPDLAPFLALEAAAGDPTSRAGSGLVVSRLLGFSTATRAGPFARAALASAARIAQTPAEKRAVLDALAATGRRYPSTPRARISAALIRTRLARTPAEAADLMADLVRAFPDAPESAPDHFEPADRALLARLLVRAAPELKLVRARALARRSPAAAADLAAPLARLPAHRLDAADLLLAAGRARAARDALVKPSALAGRDDAERLRIEALLLAADLRLLDEPARRKPAPRKRRAPRPAPAVPGALPAPPDTERLRAWTSLAARSEALLARPLATADRRRLLGESVRAAARLGRLDEARRFLPALVALDPATTVGAEELFRSAFLPTLTRAPEAHRAAAAALEEQAALYGDVAVRRRAIYWAARSLEATGKGAAARGLWASLVSTAVPDLYARWAGARLGVPVRAAVPVEPPGPPAPHALRSEAPSLPSRELLALGLASLAEDAADAERSADALFLAACASERFEFRRAVGILKARWPELGTPDEGALPLAVRRAYYPFRQEPLIVREAAANGLPPALVYGVIRQESLFQTNARSGAGATGLMQVMPGTGRDLLRREGRRGRPDLKDPEVNVALGARYLAMMLRQFDGDRIAALAGYNAGPGRPRRWRRQAPALAADEFLEAMPLFEPRDYVKRVLFFEAAYAVLHGAAVDPLPVSGGATRPRP
jgi:soluble lytic murein transglycosylase